MLRNANGLCPAYARTPLPPSFDAYQASCHIALFFLLKKPDLSFDLCHQCCKRGLLLRTSNSSFGCGYLLRNANGLCPAYARTPSRRFLLFSIAADVFTPKIGGPCRISGLQPVQTHFFDQKWSKPQKMAKNAIFWLFGGLWPPHTLYTALILGGRLAYRGPIGLPR